MGNITEYNSKRLREILNDVRMCTLLFLTRNGKIYSSDAESFLKVLKEYSKYCIPEMVDDWNDSIRKIIYSPIVPKPQYQNDSQVQKMVNDNNYTIIDTLYN